MKKRLRRKLHRKEFTQWIICFSWNGSDSELSEEAFWESFISFSESQGLLTGGTVSKQRGDVLSEHCERHGRHRRCVNRLTNQHREEIIRFMSEVLLVKELHVSDILDMNKKSTWKIIGLDDV